MGLDERTCVGKFVADLARDDNEILERAWSSFGLEYPSQKDGSYVESARVSIPMLRQCSALRLGHACKCLTGCWLRSIAAGLHQRPRPEPAYLRRVLRPNGNALPGANTFAESAACGKSRGLSVTRKSASPSCAHAQNGSSAGSGETFMVVCGEINSASSRRRLMSSPIVPRRTFSRRRTTLYSERISSETIHVKVARSIQSRRRRALGFAGETVPERKPEIPATRTEVSTTPLGRLERAVGNDRYLRERLAGIALRPHSLEYLSR
jgi:hypothetical protein